MPRTILVHLNVVAPDGDERSADEIADALLAALEVGADNPDDPILREVFARGPGTTSAGMVDSPVVCVMAEEADD